MKFRLAAAIAIYFLLILLFSTLSNTSTQKRKRDNKHTPRITQTSLLPQCKNHILSLVINEFLTCRDIIFLQQTCKDFENLLHPNGVNIVTFYVYGVSKTMATNIIWGDLNHFMKQSYYSAFDEMKMFNIKENKYAVLTRVPEKKYIVWSNKYTPYHEMLLGETTPYTPLQNQCNDKHFFYNKPKNAWAIITYTKKRHVETGGSDQHGGDSCRVQSKLRNVKMIYSNNCAFVALLDNGDVVAWGDESLGGKIPDEIQTQLVKVEMIVSTNYAFAALLDDGTVFAWGNESHGGKIPDEIQTQLVNVRMILSTDYAFVALLDNGTVVAWGDGRGGKIPQDIQKLMIKNVKMIFSTCSACVALLNDGTVVAWGYKDFGGIIPDDIQTQLIKVKQIIPKQRQFTAFCEEGKILTWGNN